MALTSQKSTVGFVEEIDHNELEFGQVVGRGAFGTVQKATWRGITVAVKQIETENEKRAFVQELKQLSRVSHENIVKLYGASTKYPVFLVMEFAECGSLYNLLHGNDPVIEYKAAHAVCWSLQAALGVSYLHNMKPKAIIHRDLKPPNLLLVKRGTVVKLCDFGTAADIQTHMTNNKGSAAWMAPEVFEGNKYSEKCDVFSWGIVLWECLSRKKPFDEIGGPAFRIMWAIHSGTRPPLLRGMPKALEKLMTRCWSKNPAERPSMDEVVRIMKQIMPFYKDQFTPLAFPGFFIDDGDEEPQGMSNESESLRIDDILNTSASPLDTPDRPRTNSSGRLSMGRPSSSRDSEEVKIDYGTFDGEPETPLVEETERPSMKSLSSMTSMSNKSDQSSMAGAMTNAMGSTLTGAAGGSMPGAMAGGVTGATGDVYSPRNIVKTNNAQKRYSADSEQLMPLMENVTIEDTPQPPPRRKFGHRRVGSHGNPPIKLEPHLHPPPSAQVTPRMKTSTSHPGEQHFLEPTHPNLHHSTSWENTMMAAYRPSRTSESTPTPPPSFSQLDDSLRPLQPMTNSNQSMLIYYEHVAAAERYMAVQAEIANTRARVAELKKQLDEQRAIKQRNRELMEKFQKLADENEEYLQMKRSLEQQLNRPIC